MIHGAGLQLNGSLKHTAWLEALVCEDGGPGDLGVSRHATLNVLEHVGTTNVFRPRHLGSPRQAA